MDPDAHARLLVLLGLSPLRTTAPGDRAARLLFTPTFHATTAVTLRHAPDGHSADLDLVTSPNASAALAAELGWKGFAPVGEVRSEVDVHDLPRERFEALWLRLQQAAALPPADGRGRDGCDVALERVVASDVRRVTLSSQDPATHAGLAAILEALRGPARRWTPGAYTQLEALAGYFPAHRR
jgi:hypothetical protein